MKHLFVVCVVALLAMSACAPLDKTAESNMAAAQRFTEEIWNKGNLEAAGEILADNFVRHNPASWQPPATESLDAFKDYVAQIRSIYPDFHVQVNSRFASGDMVAASWTVTGTNKDLNKPISLNGLSITRYAGGKAVEEWVAWDTHGLMQQLGMVNPPEMSAK